MPWIELSDAKYSGILYEDLQSRYNEITTPQDNSSTMTTRNLQEAIELLHYSNSLRPENELIVVISEKLSDLKGTVEFDRSKAEWLGYDSIALAEWSLLANGLFQRPSAFPGWVEQLNENGLFSSADTALKFGTAYLEASHRNEYEAEPLGEDLFDKGYGIDAMEIGRVMVS